MKVHSWVVCYPLLSWSKLCWRLRWDLKLEVCCVWHISGQVICEVREVPRINQQSLKNLIWKLSKAALPKPSHSFRQLQCISPECLMQWQLMPPLDFGGWGRGGDLYQLFLDVKRIMSRTSSNHSEWCLAILDVGKFRIFDKWTHFCRRHPSRRAKRKESLAQITQEEFVWFLLNARRPEMHVSISACCFNALRYQWNRNSGFFVWCWGVSWDVPFSSLFKIHSGSHGGTPQLDSCKILHMEWPSTIVCATCLDFSLSHLEHKKIGSEQTWFDKTKIKPNLCMITFISFITKFF